VESGKGGELRERAFEFACAVVELHREIYAEAPYLRSISSQGLSAATSIGANLEEADAAQSRADFISKCTISLKEAREARYWLRILDRKYRSNDEAVRALLKEVTELIAILTTIVKRARSASTKP
jgi:four helix bundle protein